MMAPAPRAEITTKRIVYPVAGADRVSVARDVPYRRTADAAHTLDLYHPPNVQPGERAPAVLLVTGYPDAGMRRVLGCTPREMASSVSWAELFAVSGMTGVTYGATDPAADAAAVLDFLCEHSTTLGIDASRMALWACSGNVPNALGVLMSAAPGHVRCAVFFYGYMLDVGGATAVADAAATFRFVHPDRSKGFEHLPHDVPVFIARAGADEMPGLNASIDAFVEASWRQGRSVTLVNAPHAPHAFDILDDGVASRAAIAQAIAFLRAHLGQAGVQD